MSNARSISLTSLLFLSSLFSAFQVIIIGNGTPKIVHAYRDKIFACPFPIYTDPTLELYRALGMTRQTGDGGADEDKGDYVKHGTLGGTLHVIRNVGKMGRKGLTLQPGHFTQLGKLNNPRLLKIETSTDRSNVSLFFSFRRRVCSRSRPSGSFRASDDDCKSSTSYQSQTVS